MSKFFSAKNVTISVGSLFFMWWTFFSNFHPNEVQEQGYPKEHYNEDTGKIYLDLGKSAYERGDFENALKAYKAALEVRPDLLEIYDRLGMVQELMSCKNDAFKTYFKAMSLHPHFNETRFAQEKNLPPHSLPEAAVLHKKAQWTGQPLNNKTIFVYAENGFGDTINFARFLSALTAQGANVLFKPQASLVTLFNEADFKITVLDKDAQLTNYSFDYYCSLLSIPYYLDCDITTIPLQNKYLNANPEKTALLKVKFFNTNDLKIGIFWQGNPALLNDENRSTKLEYFFDIAKTPGVKVYSIQKGFGSELLKQLPQEVSIIDLDPYIKDWTDTAAIINNLDLVISIDSSVAHLAGALGKQVWMLTPYVTDWRWLGYSEESSSIWYKSLKKIRQDKTCSWEPVFEKINKQIKELAKTTTL